MWSDEQLKKDDTKYMQFVSTPVVTRYWNLQYDAFWLDLGLEFRGLHLICNFHDQYTIMQI